MAADLQQALASDVLVARDVLSKKLGDIVVEESIGTRARD